MRKILFLGFLLLSLHPYSEAQSSLGNYIFQKNSYRVATVQVPYNEDRVANAIKDYMQRQGYKDAHFKDFIIFRSVSLTKESNAQADLYFNVERKSRSEKDITVVNLLPVKKGETLMPVNEEDSSFVALTKVYLDSLIHNIHSYSLNQEIAETQKSLDKIKSKMTDLKNDSGDIAKKIRNYESDLAKNKTDQAAQTQTVNGIPSGDVDKLNKAHKKMDKLLDDQNDYEKKIRNYKEDLEQNGKDRETQQALYEKQTEVLAALKQRYQNLGTKPNP